MMANHLSEMWHLKDEVLRYLAAFTPPETALMREIRQRAYDIDKEHWLVSPEVARLFQFLAKITRATRVYEIGSFLGYSGLAWAEALPDGGEVFLTEKNEAFFNLMTGYVARSPYRSKITCLNVDAHIDLATRDCFDIVLIDHDKPDYPAAWQTAKRHIAKNGLLVVDDVLWRGRVCREAFAQDPSTKGVLQLNEIVRDDSEMLSLIVPIGDGVCLATPR
jgi:caffeoyl-CoA O-methyltransferase